MAVTHDAPKELDPRAIAWTALAAGILAATLSEEEVSRIWP